MPRLAGLLAAATLALGAGCSLNYEEARMAEEASPEIPDTVMTGFTHTVVDDGRVWVRLTAARAESYDQTRRVVLSGVRLEEYDEQGGLATEAVADRAVYHSDSEDAEVTGNILIRVPKEQATLAASSLNWVKEGRRLSSGESVRFTKENGSFLEGRGFQADFRRRRLEFKEGASGGFVEDEDADR
jgi:LPS export ABC transporter protein LptC